jgi:hypothetical protein
METQRLPSIASPIITIEPDEQISHGLFASIPFVYEIVERRNAQKKAMIQKGYDIAEERQLDYLFQAEKTQRQELHDAQVENTTKLFSILYDLAIESTVQTNILQAILAPTLEYLPTQWPLIEEPTHGKFYTHPHEMMKEIELAELYFVGYFPQDIAEAILKYAPLVYTEEENEKLKLRWTRKDYQELIYKLLPNVDEETGEKLFNLFDLTDVDVSEESGYTPLRHLFLDREPKKGHLYTSFRNDLFYIKKGAEWIHGIILEEEFLGREPRDNQGRALLIYREIFDSFYNYVGHKLRNFDEADLENGITDFVLDEMDFLLEVSNDGPFYEKIEDFNHSLEILQFEGMHRIRRSHFGLEIIRRQIMPSKSGNFEGFVLQSDEDVKFTRKLLDRISYFKHDDPENEIVREIEDYLKHLLTVRRIGDTIYPES